MKKPVFGLLFLSICLTAVLIRVVQLDLRPMHHDEANQAVKFGNLLENGEYRYDRIDHHGPSLYYLSLPLIRLTTGAKFADTGEFELRLLPVLFGVGTIILLLFLTDALSKTGVVFASLLAALSPLAVFYSRFYIQETLLVFFAMGVIAAGWRYYRNPTTGWAVLTGFFAGMMYATKETCLILFAALIGSFFLTQLTMGRKHHPGEKPPPAAKKPWLRWSHLTAAIGAGLFVVVLFYSSFFKNPSGPVDSVLAFKTYFSKAGDAGFHEHPWYYYLKMLAFSKFGSGPAWSEGLILFLMLCGSAASFRKKIPGPFSPVFLRFIFFYTLLTTTAFSIIPYKTPWNMLPFFSGMIILAGAGAAIILSFFKLQPAAMPPALNSCPRGGPLRGVAFWKKAPQKLLFRLGVYLFLIVGVVNLGMQCFRANFKYYADNRNPYVYAHTVNDFKRLVSRIEDIAALQPDHYDMLIKVITSPYDTWPLPYYLRKFRRVGYWQDAASAAPLPGTPVIVASLDQDEKIRPVLMQHRSFPVGLPSATRGSFEKPPLDPTKLSLIGFFKCDTTLMPGYQPEYYGLRPEVLLVVYIRQDLWQQFLKTRAQ